MEKTRKIITISKKNEEIIQKIANDYFNGNFTLAFNFLAMEGAERFNKTGKQNR